MKKIDRSKFIEHDIRARAFHRAVQDIKERNTGTNPDELQSIIDETAREIRAEQRSKRTAGT